MLGVGIPEAITAAATLANTVIQWKTSGKDKDAEALDTELQWYLDAIQIAHDRGDVDGMRAGFAGLRQLQIRVASGSSR